MFDVEVMPVDSYLGPQLIGTLINAVLYTVEVLSVAAYFRSRRAKRERRGIALAVLFNLVVDTVGSFAVCASAYTYYVIFWGNDDRVQNSHWSLIVNIVTNSITAFVVQGFLTYRYWKLSSNKYVTVVIFGLMLFGWAGDIQLAIRASRPHRLPTDRLHDTRDVVIALAGTAAADLAITAALIWTLYTTRTSNKATKNLVRRIMTMAIITGSVTSAAASVVLITFLAVPLSRVSTCFSLFLGRIYTLTMLYVLIHRDALSQGMKNVVVDSDALQTTTDAGPQNSSILPSSSRRTDEMIFAPRKGAFPSIQSHSTPNLHRENLPRINISRHSDTFQSHGSSDSNL